LVFSHVRTRLPKVDEALRPERKKHDAYSFPLDVAVVDHFAWAVKHLFVPSVRMEFKAQVVIRNCSECQRLLEGRFDLDIAPIGCCRIVVALNDLMEDDVVLKRRDDFADVTNQATVNRE